MASVLSVLQFCPKDNTSECFETVKHCPGVSSYHNLLLFLFYCILFIYLERGEGREKEWERKKHQSVVSCM